MMPKLERLIIAYNRLTGSIPGDIVLTNFIRINEKNPGATSLLYLPLDRFHIGENRMTSTLP